MITQTAFKQLAPRRLRKVADEEFKRVAQELDVKFGTTVEVRVPRCVKKQIVFIKKDPEEIGWENVNPNLITKDVHYQISNVMPSFNWKWNAHLFDQRRTH